MSEDSEEIKNIKKWISDQGYPLEITVAETFEKIGGWHVVLSHYYKDISTENFREIDVLVNRLSDMRKPVTISISCQIECKSSTGKPWILFMSSIQHDKNEPLFLGIQNQASKILITDTFVKNDFKPTIDIPIFQTSVIGHGITQAFTNKQDIPYKAVMSAVTASQARVNQFDSPEFINMPKAKHIIHLCEIALPVVVIEDKLFECKINSSGNPEIKEISYGLLNWKGSGDLVYVPIVTKSELSKFANRMDKTMQHIIEFHENNMNTLIAYSKLVIEKTKQEDPI